MSPSYAPDQQQSHCTRERKGGREHKEKRQEERTGQEEEVSVNSASDLRSSRNPYSQPRNVEDREKGEKQGEGHTKKREEEEETEDEEEEEEEEGEQRSKPWQYLKRLSSSPITAHLHRYRPLRGACSRTTDPSPDEWRELYLGRGQNEGHLHPKRRFRRSFLAF